LRSSGNVFTGIIEEIGEVAALEAHGDSAVLMVRATRIADDLTHGASIAVNGVCLTVVGWGGTNPTEIRFDVMGETLKRSVIGTLAQHDRVNLERAVRVDARLDGHSSRATSTAPASSSPGPPASNGSRSASGSPRTSPASWPRRDRSPSTVSRSRSAPSAPTGSKWG